MEFFEFVTVVTSGAYGIGSTIDRVTDNIKGVMFIEDERINRFLAVSGQKDLNVELHCKVLHQTCELYKEFGMDCILEFIDEQHAAADASAEQSNLKNRRIPSPKVPKSGALAKPS